MKYKSALKRQAVNSHCVCTLPYLWMWKRSVMQLAASSPHKHMTYDSNEHCWGIVLSKIKHALKFSAMLNIDGLYYKGDVCNIASS